jgi:hypothetical protein
MMKKTRRRNYLINKRFQLACAGNMLLLQFLCIVGTVLIVSWVYYFVLDNHLVCTLNASFFTKMGIIFMFMAIGMLLWTLRHTHAIAGPVFKTGKLLKEAAKGNFPEHPVPFRKGDWFDFLAHDLNQCLNVMKRDKRRLEKACHELIAFKKNLERGPLSPEECLKEITPIVDLLKGTQKADSVRGIETIQ